MVTPSFGFLGRYFIGRNRFPGAFTSTGKDLYLLVDDDTPTLVRFTEDKKLRWQRAIPFLERPVQHMKVVIDPRFTHDLRIISAPPPRTQAITDLIGVAWVTTTMFSSGSNAVRSPRAERCQRLISLAAWNSAIRQVRCHRFDSWGRRLWIFAIRRSRCGRIVALPGISWARRYEHIPTVSANVDIEIETGNAATVRNATAWMGVPQVRSTARGAAPPRGLAELFLYFRERRRVVTVDVDHNEIG